MEFFPLRDSSSHQEFRLLSQSKLRVRAVFLFHSVLLPLSVLLLLAAVSVLSARTAWADSITLYGLQFQASEQVPVDEVSVKITIGVETQIVQKTNAANYIAQKTLQNPSRAREFSIVSLQKFVEGALTEKDSKRAAWGIQGLLGHLEVESAAVSDYLGELSERTNAAEALKLVISEPGVIAIPEELQARLFVSIGRQDLGWLQSKYPQSSSQIQALIREELRQRCLAALRTREFTRLDALVAVQRTVLGDQDVPLRDLTILISRLREALDHASRGEMEPLFSLAEVTKENKESGELVTPFVIDAVHHEVSEELNRGETTKAFLLLSRLDFERRTPQTHQLTRRALEQVAGSTETPLASSMVDQYLQRIAEVDPKIREAYVVALDRQIRALCNSGRVDIAADYVGRLSKVRIDPSAENDSIRVLQALAYLGRGMRASARQTIGEVQTGISPLNYLRLFRSGYYGDPLNSVLVLLIPLIVVLLVWIRRRASVLLGSYVKSEEPLDPEEDEKDRPSGFAITGSRLMTPSMQEYNRCLQVLGLRGGASLRQIKSHYRTLIKKVHPDLNQNLSALEKERFVTLTKTYDRLIELRRELRFPEN